jgi:hypothetical protein
MTVRVCDVTFSDWVSLPMEGKWSDTFIFRISSQACLPPFAYGPLIKRIVAHLRRKRACASIWVQVDAPGDWFGVEVQRSLQGLRLPFAVTGSGEGVDYFKFSAPPVLSYSPLPHPPTVDEHLPSVSAEELKCLQAIGRMGKGYADEIASLSGLSQAETDQALEELKQRDLAAYELSAQVQFRLTRSTQMDLFLLWSITPKGLSLALRSWGVPKGIEFTSRLEKNRRQIGFRHRHIARLWPAWLQAAWPQAEIWAGWSEVRIPKCSVIPDGLAWGRIHGFETLFWLEVGDAHKSRQEIIHTTKTRLAAALKYCKETGMWLVYTQLSSPWVHNAVAEACVSLPEWVAVVLGDHRQFGVLPVVEYCKVRTK